MVLKQISIRINLTERTLCLTFMDELVVPLEAVAGGEGESQSSLCLTNTTLVLRILNKKY